MKIRCDLLVYLFVLMVLLLTDI
ncbi:uncharacterized protein METZ01_LOCUS61680 [marine metagenome]|uniref:Uncharacterized protein n=1 Tax=marine metagenome TaxID=408172 RepID=A0A381SXW7_9ZZZZ